MMPALSTFKSYICIAVPFLLHFTSRYRCSWSRKLMYVPVHLDCENVPLWLDAQTKSTFEIVQKRTHKHQQHKTSSLHSGIQVLLQSITKSFQELILHYFRVSSSVPPFRTQPTTVFVSVLCRGSKWLSSFGAKPVRVSICSFSSFHIYDASHM